MRDSGAVFYLHFFHLVLTLPVLGKYTYFYFTDDGTGTLKG